MLKSPKSAFTLIETLVVLLIGALVSGAVWTIFGGSARHSRDIDERLLAVQAAQALIEVLRQDLSQAIVTGEHPIEVSQVGDGGATLAFLAADATMPAGFGKPRPGDRPVSYRFDPSTHQVLRNDEPMRLAAYEKVEFQYVDASASDVAARAVGQRLPNCVRYRVTAVAPATLDRIASGLQEETDRRGRVTLAGSVRIDGQTYRGQFPGWVEHAFEAPEAR